MFSFKILRYTALLLSLLLLPTGCGYFTPIYGDKSSTNPIPSENVAAELKAIDISPIADKIGYILKKRLEDEFNPLSENIEKKYKLNIRLIKYETPLGVRSDRTATRVQVVITANYKLIDIQSGYVLDKGSIRNEGSYNRLESEFATYSALEDTTSFVMKEMAETFKLHLMSVFLNPRALQPDEENIETQTPSTKPLMPK